MVLCTKKWTTRVCRRICMPKDVGVRRTRTTNARERVLVVSGSTGIGKSSIGEHLCDVLGGELISADSVQIYKGMDIGSNKTVSPSKPIHLVDIVSPSESFSAIEYADRARDKVKEIKNRGRVPIVVGGS